jgi:tetratricopeptide (TPR) repeat protein
MQAIADLFNQAVRYHQSGDLAQAETFYQSVIRADPCHAHAYHLLGILAHQRGKLQDAEAFLGRAVALHPTTAVFQVHLGMVFLEQRKSSQAANCFRQASALDPNDAQNYNYLGIALFEQGALAESAESFRQAIRVNPNVADAHSNLGNVLKEQGRLAEALACYEEELRIHPSHDMALWNRSLWQLLHGDYIKGWPDFERRWARPEAVPRSFPQPRWDGTPLHGKTILVHAEYGLGDTLQFLRFLPEVKERGGRAIFECPPALLELLQGAAFVDQLLPAGQEPPNFDVQIPLMSLAGLLGTTLASLPGKIPHLAVDSKRSKHWQAELNVLDGFKIGIVWQGNPTQKDDRYRSVRLAQFAPLAKVPGVRLVSLQVGSGQEQLKQVPFPVTDLGGRFNPDSLTDLAAALPCLDLVVTVCTSVAHLAGALGSPVWVALRHVPYWIWLMDRSDSPWYPSARLFRQKHDGAWDEVFERIAREISTFSPGSQNRE